MSGTGARFPSLGLIFTADEVHATFARQCQSPTLFSPPPAERNLRRKAQGWPTGLDAPALLICGFARGILKKSHKMARRSLSLKSLWITKSKKKGFDGSLGRCSPDLSTSAGTLGLRCGITMMALATSDLGGTPNQVSWFTIDGSQSLMQP
jgi:hypothetical protein